MAAEPRPVDLRLLEALQRRRCDREFMDRLHRRVGEDAILLARIAENPHQHRYPDGPNGAGFPVNQCLDCGEWIIAAPDLTPPPTERES